MIKWLLGALLLFAPSLALAQNQGQIVPSGSFTPGHTVRCQNSTCTVAVDGGGSAGSNKNGQSYLTELGITNTGTPFCINDALINAAGGYHQFCLGANALGGGLISYNAIGGASPLGLTINLNGVNYPFPGAGTGNVVGPTSPPATATHIAAWNGGTALTDPALQPQVFTNTQMNEYAASLLNGLSPSTEFSTLQSGNFATEALTGGVAVPNTATVLQATGVAGYVNTLSTTTNAVAGYFQARALADNTKIWALNTVAADRGFAVTNAGIEADTNCSNAASTCNGVSLAGVSTAQFHGSGFIAGSPSLQNIGLVKWDAAFVSPDAAATTGLSLGSTATAGTNLASQPIDFVYRDGSGNVGVYVLNATTSQSMSIATTAGSGQAVFDIDGTLVIGAPAASTGAIDFLSSGSTVYQILRQATTNSFILFDNTNGLTALSINTSGILTLGEAGKNVNMSGTINLGATVTAAPSTGTPVASLCLDASNNIIKKTTSGACL